MSSAFDKSGGAECQGADVYEHGLGQFLSPLAGKDSTERNCKPRESQCLHTEDSSLRREEVEGFFKFGRS